MAAAASSVIDETADQDTAESYMNRYEGYPSNRMGRPYRYGGRYAGRSRYVRSVDEGLEVPSAAVYESDDKEVDESYLSRYRD